MAYEVHLNQFDGPLDLLLHLICQAQVDVNDIFVSEITSQYLSYMSEADALDMDTASEFLTMAATLLYIKSRQLLPKAPVESEETEDPETVLIRQLREYQAFKAAGEELKGMYEEAGRAFARLPEDVVLPPLEVELENATVSGLVEAFLCALSREKPAEPVERAQRVRADAYTVRSETQRIRGRLLNGETISFSELFSDGADRMRKIVTFMAILEMLLHGEVHVHQSKPFAEIKISGRRLLAENEPAYVYMDEQVD